MNETEQHRNNAQGLSPKTDTAGNGEPEEKGNSTNRIVTIQATE